MSTRKKLTLDGNEAVAHVAYRLNEVMAIYPITPSSTMAEWCDQWTSEGKRNLWGTIPGIIEMQSEGGAVGAVHGMLQTGSIATTFTASQGLLLMVPNMFKIAGELLPTVFHVTARAVATHALSIFGDHSDIMACRTTGWAMLGSASVQEATDFALIAQAATLRSRIPFVHFFDGFRTSHEVQKIEMLDEADLRALIDDKFIAEHRARGLSPDRPVLRGTAQNPDAFFQAREACNPFYAACPDIVQQAMDDFAKQVGRGYKLFEYEGSPLAEHVVVLMGSGCEAAHETVDYLNQHGEKVGIVKVRLYRPFDSQRFVEALPATVRSIAVLDRTKEPGAAGEPLFQDCAAAICEGLTNNWGRIKMLPRIVGGRYGLSSKEFTPAMVKAVFDNLKEKQPKNHFTVGINDDVSHTSLSVDHNFSTEPDNVIRALFYGLGADGTVGANKNSIKIIGEGTDNFAQGYFVYDSKKSGSMTVSHLRFGPEPIRSTYLVSRANFVACHLPTFLEKYDMVKPLISGGTFLLNTPYSKDEIWSKLPTPLQESLIAKKAKFYVIDATKVAHESGMGGRINTIMQVCFFALSGVLPRDKAIEAIKYSIKKTYGKKGEEVVAMNLKAVDNTLEHLHEVPVTNNVNGSGGLLPPMTLNAPQFVKDVLGKMAAGEGEELPVSAFPVDGTFPTGTAQYEKRNLALDIPVWDEKVCIQCLKCVAICPHATIRAKVYEPASLKGAPATFKSTDSRVPDFKGSKFTLQVAAEDCTGCGICVDVCPAKNKTEAKLKAINMRPQAPLRLAERENWNFFLDLPETDRRKVKTTQLRQQQLLRPLFEFSGACAGCGETPYIKMLSQLFGDRAVIANATGCSSIYGGNLPTTPYAKNAEGRGPTWCNSLFEDNAEFGLGFRVSLDKQRDFALELLKKLAASARPGFGGRNCEREPGRRSRHLRAARTRRGLEAQAAKLDSPEAKLLLRSRRQAGEEERVDHRRRRLGLRHRLRRLGPRAGQRPQGERARARHRGLFQHRRADVQIHPARRGGEVRRRRQGDGQERPRPDRDDLRPHLRGERGAGREGRTGAQGVRRGGIVSRPVAHHRLQPLHRARHRGGHGRGRAPAETRGGFRPVAARIASTRAAPNAARTRCSSIRPRPRPRCRILCSRKTGSRCSPRASRRTRRNSSRRRRPTPTAAGSCINSWPRATQNRKTRRHPRRNRPPPWNNCHN